MRRVLVLCVVTGCVAFVIWRSPALRTILSTSYSTTPDGPRPLFYEWIVTERGAGWHCMWKYVDVDDTTVYVDPAAQFLVVLDGWWSPSAYEHSTDTYAGFHGGHYSVILDVSDGPVVVIGRDGKRVILECVPADCVRSCAAVLGSTDYTGRLYEVVASALPEEAATRMLSARTECSP